MIYFTQYMRPDGRKQENTIERSPEVEAMAREVVEAGGRFEIEVLRTGEVSMEVVMGDEDEPLSLAHEICANGPAVPEAVDRLVVAAHLSLT